MKQKLNKYFWSLNPQALEETRQILRNPDHPKFVSRMITLLGVCDKPRELFDLVPRETFVEQWPAIKRKWRRTGGDTSLYHWWDAVYAQLVADQAGLKREQKSAYLKAVGQQIREARLSREWTQKDLAARAGLPQMKISRLENGQANITLETLIRLARVLGLESVKLGLSEADGLASSTPKKVLGRGRDGV